MPEQLTQAEAFEAGTSYQFDAKPLTLGPWNSYSFYNDPKHTAFVLSRYKFVAKMLGGSKEVLEVGCGDGFGIPITAQAVEHIVAIDVDDRLIDNNKERLTFLKNVDFIKQSICDKPICPVGAVKNLPTVTKFDAAYAIDVIEHLDADLEEKFMTNIADSLGFYGVCILGTPNITAAPYASPQSEIQHINLKSQKTLHELMEKYFVKVFDFGMNDEIVHTGYGNMCHYLFSMGICPR